MALDLDDSLAAQLGLVDDFSVQWLADAIFKRQKSGGLSLADAMNEILAQGDFGINKGSDKSAVLLQYLQSLQRSN